MGDLFTLTPDILALAKTAFSDLIVEMGKNCELYYTNTIPCENCIPDDMIGRGSVYNGTGPNPFNLGMCPLCNGTGNSQDFTSEIIRMSVNKEIKSFFGKVPNIRIPDGSIQTRGYIADLPKVLRCDHMICQVELKPYIVETYKLYGTPTDKSNIVQNTFFYATWERYETGMKG